MRTIKKVVSTVWYKKADYHRLRNVFPEAEFVYVDFYNKEKIREEVRDADVAIIIGDVDDALLGDNTLQWVQCDHSGLNGSARDEVFKKGFMVTGAAGRNAPALAEHCIYFMMQYCYHTKELLAAQEKGMWGVEGVVQWKALYGRTVGIAGMGNNGRMLADRVKALGMKIYAYDKFPFPGYDDVERKLVESQGDTIDPLLENCDFVVLTLPLTGETYHMFDKETINKMKPGAFLVNMSRGGIVDTEALTEAIQGGRLGGAGLDVIEEVPLPAEHPLWHLPGVYITPHVTPQIENKASRTIDIIEENARRFRNEEPLKNLMKPADKIEGEKGKGGWSKMMNVSLTKEQAEKLHLEKYLGKLDWTDPSEWNYLDQK